MTSKMKIERGKKVWRNEHGKRHRTDGPAVEWASGRKEWYLSGQLHRADGPAIEWANGYKEWYFNGRRVTEEEFNSRQNEAADAQKATDTQPCDCDALVKALEYVVSANLNGLNSIQATAQEALRAYRKKKGGK